MTLLAALDCRECRTVERLAELTGMTNRHIVNAAARLIERGLADRAERGCFTRSVAGEEFQASGGVIKSGPRGHLTGRNRRPKRRTVRDRMWGALRIRGKVSVPELIELVSIEGETVTRGYVQRYLRALVAAGYLRELSRREPGTAPSSNGFKRFLLLRDTGPLTPLHSIRTHSILDPNTNEVICAKVFE